MVLLASGCLRTADDFEGKPTAEELEELRHDACEALCETTDRCDPTRFANEDPPDCFERCMTLMPKIYMDNQCGSREMQWMFCVGELSCLEYESWDLSLDRQDYEGTPCVSEFGRAVRCDERRPFDMNEDNSHYP